MPREKLYNSTSISGAKTTAPESTLVLRRKWILTLTQSNLRLQPLGLPGHPQTTMVDPLGFQQHQPHDLVHQHGKCKNCDTALMMPQHMKKALQSMIQLH
jgi:hypothetical protein